MRGLPATACVHEPCVLVHAAHWPPPPPRAHRSLELHGATAARHVLNAEGMGGSASWADPRTGLAVCIAKNVYEPLSALGGSISPDVIACAAELRLALGLAEPLDEALVAAYGDGAAGIDHPGCSKATLHASRSVANKADVHVSLSR